MNALHLRAFCIAVFTAFTILSFLGIVGCNFHENTVKKARCYAHCLTLYNPGSPNASCHSDRCRECGSACEKISLSLANCNASCQNSSVCLQTCEYIETIKQWSDIVKGDGTPIEKPPVPTVQNKNVTSLTLSWQPGIQNVSGRVVYLLKKRANIPGSFFNTYTDWYTMIFSQPYAELTVEQVCQSVIVDKYVWPRPFQFFFTVAALTENSTLVEGQESGPIEMEKPGQVGNISVPVYTYEKNTTLDKLLLTISITPSSDQSIIATNYGIRWQSAYGCKGPSVNPRMDNRIKDISKASLRIYEKQYKCKHSLEVYQQVHCVTGTIKKLSYNYPGCQNIPSFDKTFCYKFDPPSTPERYRSVRNLTYAKTYTDPDFRFRRNLTWLPPTYPYVEAKSYNVQYGDANKVLPWGNVWIPEHSKDNIKNTYYELTGLLPNVNYKAKVTPVFPTDYTVSSKSSTISFKTQKLPSEQLIVRDVRVRSNGFSVPGYFSYNISWKKQLFPYGTLKGYVFNVTHGNVLSKNETNNTFAVINGLLYSESRTFEVKPTYKEEWIKGVTFRRIITANELPSEQLIVRDVRVRSNGFSVPGYFSYNITWKRPTFPYGTLKGYVFNVTHGNVTSRNITNNTFVVINGIQHSESRTFKVKPTYEEKWINLVVTSSSVITAPDPDNNQLTVGSLGQEGDYVEDKKNNTYTIVFSWTPPSFQYKVVDYYQVSYSLSGYPEFAVDCNSNVKDTRCWPLITNKTRYTLTEILPREYIVFKIKPVFSSSPNFNGLPKTFKINAPYPRRSLVAVRNLTHNQQNNTNSTSFFWEPPLFKHSAVKQYDIKYSVENVVGTSSAPNKVFRRSTQANGTNTMVDTSITVTTFSLPKLKNGKRLTFQVTPVFKREIIVGERKEIVITTPSILIPINKKNTGITPAEKGGLSVGIILLLLLAIVLIFWFVKRRQRLLKEGLLVGGHGAMLDHWEVPIEKIYLEEELGEGAFGKVFKGMLVELPEQSAKYSIAKSIRRKSIKPLYPEDGYVVAIKMLHDFADIDQRREFLKEIQLMKDVGSHRNIVNMLGCGTVCEPMFLIVEYLPNGDLLHYLRKRRGKAMQYPDSDPRGPYHSTYCQTYFNKNNPEGGISLQQSRSDRVYVHTPEPQKQSKNGDIQLVSMQKNEDTERQGGMDNPGIEQQTENNPEHGMEEENEEDDVLTSGDLMAFAWQVSQGMEYLSKRGYVHRDLAARNVLVGNNKEAKIADFGLTRHMYEDLYQAKTNRKLPLKWMSIEAIFDQSFTSQSDVWAYGVFLWELVTLGGTPYPSINNRELLKLLKEGYRMEKPETCDTELYKIMCKCWKEKPEDRPTFVDLREKLEEMMTRDNPYFDPTAVDESRDYYNVPSFNSAPEPDEDDDITEVIIGEASSPRDEVKDNEDANKNTINSSDGNKSRSLEQMSTNDDTLTFDNLSFDADKPELDLDQVAFDNDAPDNAERSKKDQKSLKYAKLDFEDIEFQLYRRQNNGLVL